MISSIFPLLNVFLALLAGLGLVQFSKRVLNVDNGAFLIAGLFAPAVLLLGFSGHLLGFKGFGIEAQFQQAASRQVAPSVIKPNSPSTTDIRARSSGRAWLGIGSEVVLLEAAYTTKPVSPNDVADYAARIYPGLLQGNFEMLVVHDSANRVLGYFPRHYFLDILRIEIEQTLRGSRKERDSKRVGEQLEQTLLWDIFESPRMRADSWGVKTTVRTNDTNAYALSVMAEEGLESIVVVDRSGAYAGFVRRKDIVADLLLSLAGASLHDVKK